MPFLIASWCEPENAVYTSSPTYGCRGWTGSSLHSSTIAARLVDPGQVEPGVDALREQVERDRDEVDVAGALAVPEQRALDALRARHQAELGGRDGGAAVVVRMDARGSPRRASRSAARTTRCGRRRRSAGTARPSSAGSRSSSRRGSAPTPRPRPRRSRARSRAPCGGSSRASTGRRSRREQRRRARGRARVPPTARSVIPSRSRRKTTRRCVADVEL